MSYQGRVSNTRKGLTESAAMYVAEVEVMDLIQTNRRYEKNMKI